MSRLYELKADDVFHFTGDWQTEPGTYRVVHKDDVAGVCVTDKCGARSYWFDNCPVVLKPTGTKVTGFYS